MGDGLIKSNIQGDVGSDDIDNLKCYWISVYIMSKRRCNIKVCLHSVHIL